MSRLLKNFSVSLLSLTLLLTSSPLAYIKPPIPLAHALTTSLTTTACNVNDTADTSCQTALSADGGTGYSFTKGTHIDAPLATLSGAGSVNSAILYYDSSGTLSGTWGIYLKDARDGTTICSTDPAPENGSETRNSINCTVTPAQLANGVWLYVINNDDKGPENITLEYVYLYLDYTAPAISISLTTDGSVAFGYQPLNSTRDTTAGDLNDVETISVDSGPADLDAKSTVFTQGGNTWTLGSGNGTNQVKWEFSPDGSSWTTFAAAGTDYVLATNVPQGNTQNLYLRLTTPTDTSYYNQFSSTITITASTP